MPRPPSTKLGQIISSLNAVQVPEPETPRDPREPVANVVPAGKRWEVRFSVRGKLMCLGRATDKEKVVRFADFLSDQRGMPERTPAYIRYQRRKDAALPAFQALWEMLKPYLAENRVTLARRVAELELRVAQLEAEPTHCLAPNTIINTAHFTPVYVGPAPKTLPDAPPEVMATKTGLEEIV